MTFNFLHIGLMHLMFNCSALFSIGPQVEGIFGSQKFVFAYVATGIGSGLASLMFLPANTAGASGAIFGLIGLMAVYGYRLGGSFGRGLMRQMLIWAGIGIMFGFFIGANNVAHVGGFVAGGALGFVLEPDAPSTATSAVRWNGAAICCIGLVAISFVMAGRVYGAEQEKGSQREAAGRRYERAREFSLVVAEAGESVDDSFDLNRELGVTRKDAVARAIELRRVAEKLDKAPTIDDRSAVIKTRLIELINKRANALDQAVNDSMIAAALSADREAFAAAFKDYSDWVNSAKKEFKGLFEQ